MHPTITRAEFRKSRDSAPQQSCVYISRKHGRTLIWDDKLADPDMTDTTEVPPSQCLVFTDAEFDIFQNAIRRGDTDVIGCLTITASEDGAHVVFAATDPTSQPDSALQLRFFEHEVAAFIAGVHSGDFDLTAFAVAA